MTPFTEFPKMARLCREAIIMEKIDGTNAQIFIEPINIEEVPLHALGTFDIEGVTHYMAAGSRTRWITPEADNYGFARWAKENLLELSKLGPGRHFGEWYGQGIQRNYGLKEKRFSLFNTTRWADDTVRPACCHVVPIIHQGTFSTDHVDFALGLLRDFGSLAAPGFKNAEGIVVYHLAAGIGFKQTLEKDEVPKTLVLKNP